VQETDLTGVDVVTGVGDRSDWCRFGSELCSFFHLKDRLGDQRGGSEWEPIKILPEG
jgi:hypothetical protein